MAKKYDQKTYTGLFQGRAQSLGFNPEKAIDTSKQFEQRTKERNRDLQTYSNYLKRENAVASSQLKADQAKSNANFAAFKGLLSLSQQGMGLIQEMDKQQKIAEQEAYEQFEAEQMEGAMADMAGFSFGDDSDPTITEKATGLIQSNQDTTVQVEAEGQAINEVANDSDLTPGAQSQFRQTATQVQYTGVQGNVYSARDSHMGYIQARMDELPDAARPKTEAEAMALIKQWNAAYIRQAGVMGSDMGRRLAIEKMAPTVVANSTNLARATAKASTKLTHTANATQLSGALWSASQSGASADEMWRMASDGTAFGNMGFNGRSALSNEAAIKELTATLVQSENVSALIRLRDTPKIPGNPGAGTLGDTYGDVIDKAIESARSSKVREWGRHQDDRKMVAEQMIEEYYANPTPEARAELAQNLAQLGPTGRAEANRLTSSGLNVDPQYELELAQRQAQGEHISTDELQQALASGRIRESVYTQQMKLNKDAQIDGEVSNTTKGMSSIIRQSIKTTAGDTAQIPPSTQQEINIRSSLLTQDLNSRLQAEVRANPALKDNPREMQIAANNILAELLKEPQYSLVPSNEYGGIQWGAPIRDPKFTEASQSITVAPGEQSVVNLTAAQVLDNNVFPRSELDVQDDYILSQQDTTAAAQITDGAYSDRIQSIAKGLGISPKALVEGQLRRYNMPSAGTLRNAPEFSTPNTGGPGVNLTKASGHAFIKNNLGFPARGAAYLTSAIDHESTWHGTREWGQVAGDGTNRNGGLISWASWAHNSARLGKIERHFGRNIATISETEQLEYMKLEMQKSYPRAYRIFMDANASSDDLRWAVSNYWGFDPRYTGNRWVDAEKLIASN